MSLLLPDSGLLFWMALTFGLAFFIVAKWGFPVIIRMVEEWKAYIDQSLKAAEEANRLLAEVHLRSEAMLEEAGMKQLSMLRETAQLKEQIVADAKEAAQRETIKMMEETKKQIRLEREAMLAEVHGQVAMVAIGVAEKVLRRELQEKDHQMDLINHLLDETLQNKLNERLI